MDSELWSPRNKLEDVLEACQAGDLTRAHMAALELSMRLNHAEAAWKRLSAPVVVDSSPLPDLPPLPPPRRLDEIVTRNRDQVEIRLATEAEVAALGEFMGSPEGLRDGEVKDTLTGWYPVFLRVRECHVIRLLGQREKRGDISLVSRVLMLDQAAGLALTSRSIYRLVFGKCTRWVLN